MVEIENVENVINKDDSAEAPISVYRVFGRNVLVQARLHPKRPDRRSTRYRFGTLAAHCGVSGLLTIALRR